jgi:hypothetical protein
MTINAISPPSRYRAILLDAKGNVVGIERLTVGSDDEALARAEAMAAGYAVELWDGLRFLEHFDPGCVAT